MKKYFVKLYKNDRYYIYLKSEDFTIKFLTFVQLVQFIESNNIDFKYVKFSMNLHDLFFHICDYDSVKEIINRNNYHDKKRKEEGNNGQ